MRLPDNGGHSCDVRSRHTCSAQQAEPLPLERDLVGRDRRPSGPYIHARCHNVGLQHISHGLIGGGRLFQSQVDVGASRREGCNLRRQARVHGRGAASNSPGRGARIVEVGRESLKAHTRFRVAIPRGTVLMINAKPGSSRSRTRAIYLHICCFPDCNAWKIFEVEIRRTGWLVVRNFHDQHHSYSPHVLCRDAAKCPGLPSEALNTGPCAY